MYTRFKLLRNSIIGFVLMMNLTLLFGQNINIIPKIFPPYNVPFDELKTQIMVDVMNTSTTNHTGAFLRIYLEGTDNSIIIRSKEDFIYLDAFDLDGMKTETRSGNMGHLDDAFNSNNLSFQGITAGDVYDNGLPTGSYTLCFRLYSNDYEPISDEAPSGCTMFNILPPRAVEPPQLITPICGNEITTGNNNIVFSWTIPPGSDPSTTYYALKMIELLPNQDPNQAFLSSTVPAFFEKNVQMQNSILYGPTDPPLESGKRYAWQVIAKNDEFNTAFENDGRSEVCWFTWKPNTFTFMPLESEPLLSSNNILNFTEDLTQRPLHLNTFKGKIIYSFRATEPGLEAIEERNRKYNSLPAGVYSTESTNLTDIFSSDTGNSTHRTKGNDNFGFIQTSGMTEIVEMLKSDQEKKQDDINKIIGGTKFPLVNSEVELFMYLDEYNFDLNSRSFMKKIEKKILIGKGVTNDNGDFSITYFGDLKQGKELDLVINNNHFQFSTYRIPIYKKIDGTYDLGLITGVAKTFRLKLKAEDEDKNKLEDVSFKIYRVSNFYNNGALNKNLKYEGNREKNSTNNIDPGTETLNKTKRRSLELVAEGGSENIYSRLFFSLNFGEYYIIKSILDGKVIKEDRYLAFGKPYANYVKESVLLYKKTILIPLPNPVLEGRVIIKNSDGIAAAGARIYIKNTKRNVLVSYLKINAVTDSTGYFKLENIPQEKEPYKLLIKYQNASFVPDIRVSLDKKGINFDLGTIEIEGHLEKVCGQTTDEEGNPLPNVSLKWKNGNKNFESDENGFFITSQVTGAHTLLATANGFRNKEFIINVGSVEPSKWKLTSDLSFYKTDKPIRNTNNIPSLYKIIGMKKAGAFENGITFENAGKMKLFGVGKIFNANSDNTCNHILKMSKFYVKVIITDAINNKSIAESRAKSEWGNYETANEKGVVVLKNMPYGASNLIIAGPKNSSYLSISTPIKIENMKRDTLELKFSLEKGIDITGRVNSGLNGLSKVEIYVEGKTHINTVSDDKGNYKLAVPNGKYKIVALKKGYLADKKTNNFEKGKAYNINFNLEKPEFNAEKLMGYDLLLSEYKKTTKQGEYSISGQITNLTYANGLKPKGANKLAFHDVLIRKLGNTIEPIDNEISLNTSNIEFLIYKYLKAKAYSVNGLKLTAVNGNKQKGAIVSPIKIDLKHSFPNIGGLTFSNKTIFLKTNGSKNIEISRSDGKSSIINYVLSNEDVMWKLYGFEIKPDFSNSNINEKELNLAASLKITAIRGVNPITVKIKKLTISNTGRLKNISIASNFDIDIAQWKLKISNIGINSYGISLAGNMDVAIPGSSKSSIGVSDLLIKTSGITGGKFYFPNAGLNIYDVVKIKTIDNQPFALQKVPASSSYQLAGGALLELPKYISKKVELPYFSIATNGNFGFKIKPDLNLEFADMASFELKNLGFKSASRTLDIGGKIKLDIPNFGIGAETNLHYSKSDISVDEIGIEFNLASAIAMDAKLKFADNEFAGGGSLKLADMDSGIGLHFHYKKLSGGKDIGAKFKTGVVIPIGIVKLDQLGGGFNINTATDTYSITANGRITFAADQYGAIALNPVTTTIISTPKGPIFDGGADLVLMNSWNVGKSTFKLDFADKYYYLDAKMGTGVKLMKGISFSSTGGLHLELSTKSNNSYWFVSAYSKASVAKLFNSGVTMVGGWNVSKFQHSSLGDVPKYMLYGGKIYGGYFDTHTNFSSHVKLGLKNWASISGSLYNRANATIFANIKTGSYGAKFENGFGGNFKVKFLHLGLASASLNVYSGFNAYFKSNKWGANANLKARANANIGCDGSCNSIATKYFIPCGATICANVGVKVSYSSSKGIKFHLN